MNKTEYLLSCLSEECAEIAKEVAKAQRFGLQDTDPNSESRLNNGQKISCEIADLLGVFELLIENGDLRDTRVSRIGIELKKERVKSWMQYSKEKGCLDEN